MLAWLIYEEEAAKRNSEYINFYIEAGKERGVDIKLVLADELFDSPMCDFAIVRAMRPDISQRLEAAGIPVFNSAFVSEICNDKAKTYQYLSENGVPVLPWVVSRGGASVPTPSFPCVVKPCDGHGGDGVCLAKDISEYNAAVKNLSGRDFLVQKPAGRLGYDLRAYIIGKTPVAAVARHAKDDFRSNFSLGGNVKKAELTEAERKLISKVCSLFKFGLVGIDIMYDGEEPVINEIEDVVGSRMLYATHSDINIVSLYLDFILKELNELHA